MPLDDHTLILQLERTTEALADDIKDLTDTDQFADIDHDHDDWYATDSRMSEVEDDLSAAEKQIDDHTSRLDDLAERVIALEERIGMLETLLATHVHVSV